MKRHGPAFRSIGKISSIRNGSRRRLRRLIPDSRDDWAVEAYPDWRGWFEKGTGQHRVAARSYGARNLRPAGDSRAVGAGRFVAIASADSPPRHFLSRRPLFEAGAEDDREDARLRRRFPEEIAGAACGAKNRRRDRRCVRGAISGALWISLSRILRESSMPIRGGGSTCLFLVRRRCTDCRCAIICAGCSSRTACRSATSKG